MNNQLAKNRKQSIREYMQTRNRDSWAVLRSISSSDLETVVYESDGSQWTIKDLLAHLADAEKGLVGQARRMSQGQPTVPEGFDLDRWNRGAVRRLSGRSLKDHLQQIEASFQDALQLLEELDREQLDWRGRHSSGSMMTLEEYFRRIVDHRLQHANDIRKAIAADGS